MKKKPTSVRLPEDVLNEIKAMAKRENRTYTNMVETILVSKIKEEKKK
jgi:predicted DNA-binding protein